MVSETYPELLSLALELAELAQEQILPRYLHCAVRIKGDGSEVTEADRAAEAAMRKRILERCPGHSILGEEYGPEGVAGARFQWLLDPVDGTASFTIGVPMFGTLVGLVDEGRPVVGVIHLPGIRETVYAAQGHGCWFQHGDSAPTQVTVERRATLAESVVSATAVRTGSPKQARLVTVFPPTSPVRGSSGSFRTVFNTPWCAAGGSRRRSIRS
jgi:histidinol-phosphatase